MEAEARSKGLSDLDCDLVGGFRGGSKDDKSSSIGAFEIGSVPNANDVNQDDAATRTSRRT